MQSFSSENLENIYSLCRSFVGRDAWKSIIKASGDIGDESLPGILASQTNEFKIPDFLPEMARLERAIHIVSTSNIDIPEDVSEYEVNPTLDLLSLSWRISPLLSPKERTIANDPKEGEEWVMVWRDPKNKSTRVEEASKEDLLVLKILAEGIRSDELAKAHSIPVGKIDSAFRFAAKRGILIAPKSLIRRTKESLPNLDETPDLFVTADTFTLQWHITHACDLECKHCYDRSQRSPLTLDQGVKILDDLRTFTKEKHVRGHVCFSGGNPFLHPKFFELYKAAEDRGFSASILGNPVPRKKMMNLIKIQRPGYYQVSLEGLPEHNDKIRGEGFYLRVIEFLGTLRDLGISSAIMLTLTKDNIDQVLPLAERLRGHTDHFTFNRLSCVGSGADLALPSAEEYARFLEKYIDAAKNNPIMGFKDNLINIILEKRGWKPFDGCTGFGCGAAFNFLAILPDGDTHACRKFPSPLGNLLKKSLSEIYDSEASERYRTGCTACLTCSLKHVCGGCLSITDSCGFDMFAEKDPFCFHNR